MNWKLNGTGALTLAPTNGTSGNLTSFGTTDTPSVVPWYNCRTNVRSFHVSTGPNTVGTSGTFTNMFRDCVNLANVDLTGLDASRATSLFNMFRGCIGLRSVDLSSLVTTNVTNLSNMFTNCTSLSSVDLSGNSFVRVNSMESMFLNCTGLSDIVFGDNFYTENVVTMAGMFQGCNKLASIDLSKFKTACTDCP